MTVEVFRAAIGADDADRAFDQIVTDAAWRQDQIVMFGKSLAVPRLASWYGDPGAVYSYSGLTMEPEPWLPCVIPLKTQVEELASHSFNSVLMNLYRDGRDSMGWHSDDEVELGSSPIIASISLGDTRRFNLRRRDDKSVKRSIELAHGDVLIMAGDTQSAWQHQVPKTTRMVGPRVNLTFRTVLMTI